MKLAQENDGSVQLSDLLFVQTHFACSQLYTMKPYVEMYYVIHCLYCQSKISKKNIGLEVHD